MPHILGHINSIQTLGTLDGPGVRFVAFMQGCNLRCGCCHNPDTWSRGGGIQYTAEMLFERALRYRSYFGEEGGVTLSGGEPLLQADFAREFFSYCKDAGLNTCLDTSGNILDDKVKELLSVTDRVLLDIKYAADELYKKHVGCSIDAPLEFLRYLDLKGIKTTLRQVVIPTLNDDESNTEFLKSLIRSYHCIDKVELLPFKKICKVKYDRMRLPFAFDKYETPIIKDVAALEAELNAII
ncbi:MAG: pyruvate formate lyase-activating protein [Clostridia bacterium]|nr:pyruvate formate lyase-activating protein [Clostridia bacterium]